MKALDCAIRQSATGGSEMKERISFTPPRLAERAFNRSSLFNATAITTYVRKALLVGLFIFVLTSIPSSAQERPHVFALPDARMGEAYRVNIEDVLRDKYGLKLEAGTSRAILLWSVADGDIPAGISMRTDGTVAGTPATTRVDDYQFRLRVVDASVKDEELLLAFSLAIKPGRLRLSQIAGPRLVPVAVGADSNSGSPSSGSGSSSLETSRTASRADDRADSLSYQTQAEAKRQLDKEKVEKADKAAKEQAEVEKAATNPFSDLNKRFILGFEQTGAAASESTGKPFFDIFINTPLSRKKECKDPETGNVLQTQTTDCLPRFSVWGDVRLTSTAEQVKALADVQSDSVAAITGGKLNQIASAFDFTVGPEVRLARFNNTHLGLIAGFGAVSPLSPTQSAQIFQVPDEKSSQAAAFFAKYPGAKGKDQIAFIAPDRDRFLRQYFAGFRFKTYNVLHCEKNDNDCITNGQEGELQRTFPATFDVTFGQNEAVTGGHLHKFVVGLDGFYPLPFPDKARFLYLFGSARLKAGGPKNNATPFILATAASSVKITDPTVFIADPTPTNRDTYRIGFGVDLFELFKFAKDKGTEQGEKNEKERTLRAKASGSN
jgi:Putative Ig domain